MAVFAGLHAVVDRLVGELTACRAPAAGDSGPGEGAAAGGDPAARAKRAAHLSLLKGVEACTQGDPVTGVARFQEAFIQFREIGETEKASLAQKVVSLLFDRIDDERQARAAYAKARSLLEQAGMKDEAARVLVFAGDYEVARRCFPDGFRHYKAAISLCHGEGFHEIEADAQFHYARAEVSRGRLAEGRKLLAQASAAAERSEDAGLIERVREQSSDLLRSAR
ncbi:MAG: hypothetical protein MI723_03095 [Caulobacterales bacterium]|nr:hypothetical protein [Caulobacterales bacterium]